MANINGGIVYADSDGEIISVHATETAATNAAQTGQTAVALTFDLASDMAPGWYYDSTTQTVSPIPFRSVTEMRADWFRRTKQTYIRGMDQMRQWWPQTRAYGDRARSQIIIDYELPNWWWDIHLALAQAISGRAWSTMTTAQIEACVAHIEDLLYAKDIVRVWYGVGLGRSGMVYADPDDDSDPDNATSPQGTGYIRRVAFTIYSDAFSVTGGTVLVSRTPDYAWNSIAPAGTWPTDWNPENPS